MIVIHGLSEALLHVNGEDIPVVLRPGDSLLRVLREQAGIMGPKGGCENGDCGACTVLLDAVPVKSCLILAVEATGKPIITVEGLNNTEVQKAYHEMGGFQCGYCTAGFIMNTFALLEAHPDADENVKNDWLSSNLCRCTGYEGIQKAVNLAQERILNNR